MSVHSLAVAMVRRHGSRLDDLILRAIAAVVVLGILGLLLDPTVAALTPFVLYTLLTNGPYSAVLPAAYEPALLLYGQLFSPLLIAALGTLALVFIEWVNYHLYGRARDTHTVRNLTAGRWAQGLTRMFEWRPFLAIVFCALGVVPYWIARCLSVLSRYPLWRHLTATALGRFPRLWAIAALGMTLNPPRWIVLTAFLCSFAFAGWMWLFGRRFRRPVTSLVSQSA